MRLAFNEEFVASYNINNFRQELNMQNGTLNGAFQYKDFVSVTFHPIYYVIFLIV